MSLRIKLAIAMVALAVGSAVAVGAASYVSTENQLRDQVDHSLDEAAIRILGTSASDLPGRQPGDRPPMADEDDDEPGSSPDDFRSFTQIQIQVLDGRRHGGPRAELDRAARRRRRRSPSLPAQRVGTNVAT